jgi:hypothetical protein
MHATVGQRLRVGCALVAAAAATALLASCRSSSSNLDQLLKVQPLTLAAPAGSGMPQITISGDRAVVSWLEIAYSGATLKFAERTAAGWTEPRTVASGTDWFVNAADVPSVIRLDDGTLAAHWLIETDPRREAYDVRLAFSKDDGRTWSAATSPHHDGTKTQHGFVSMFPLPGGGLGLVWLDARQTDDPENDNMSVRASAFDRDGRQLSETVVDNRVCDCCPMSVATTPDGPIVAYRDRSDAEVRDIAVSRLVSGAWTSPKTVHDDRWEIEACPVNGPAISARGRTVAVAWFTAADDQGRAFAAFSQDAGATFGAPVRLDDLSSLGRVGIALVDDGSAVASWVELVDKRAELRFRRLDSSGRRSAAQTVSAIGAGRASGYPRLARRGEEILFAWTETRGDEPSTLRTAAAQLPR